MLHIAEIRSNISAISKKILNFSWFSLSKQPDTSGNFDFDSTVCSLSLQSDAHCSGMHAPEIDSAVGFTLWRLSTRCDVQLGDCLREVMQSFWDFVFLTSEKFRTITSWRVYLRWDAHRRDYLHVVMHTAEIDSAVECTLRSFVKNSNFSAKYKLSTCIRGPEGFDSWIKWRFQISWHTPFKKS